MSKEEDKLASNTAVGAWVFDAETVKKFDEHVAMSVAGYNDIQDVVIRLSDWATPNNATIVDLGLSTGTTLYKIQERHFKRAFKLIGYDISEDMLNAAKTKITPILNPKSQLSLYEDFTQPLAYNNADLTISIFTLQFISKDKRVKALKDILNASKPGAMFLIAEKVIPSDSRWAILSLEMSLEDKRIAGLPEKEILLKAEAIRGVLNPVMEDELIKEALTAGWEAPFCLYSRYNWRLYGFYKPLNAPITPSNAIKEG